MAKEYVVDGHIYHSKKDIPDLGSLKGFSKSHTTNQRSYSGLYSDRDKLPVYDDLATGSDAILIDPSDGLHYMFYEETTKTWYEG